MPKYRYVDAEPRHYPDPGIGEASHGDVRDFRANDVPTDGRWLPKDVPAKRAPRKRAHAATKPVEPAADATETEEK